MKRRLLLVFVVALCLATVWSWSRRSPLPAPAAPAKRPSDWGWLQRTLPHFTADADAYRVALDQAQALRAAAKHGRFGTWTFAGPSNVGGRVVDLAFDPQMPSTIYAAAATGGVFKSTDDGRTWQPIFDGLATLNMGDLAVDPQRPHVVYAGTGEANGGHNNFAGGGLYKSTDGGASWRYSGLEATVSIGRVLVDPRDPERVFVAAAGSYFAPNPERGVYRSRDGGETWEQMLFVSDSTGVIDLVQRPDRPDTLFAAAWHRVRRPLDASLGGVESGIFRSYDGGETWEKLGPEHGLPHEATRPGRIGLAICEGRPDVMYALYTDGTRYTGLYRSDDGGATWRDADPARRAGGGGSNFSWYFGQVRVHPQDPERVYVLDVLLATSTNGGRSWTFDAGTHVDHHALAFHPADPDVLVNGNDGGIALSRDGGASWDRAGDLPITQFYEIGVDPSHPERLYGGTQDNGTVRTRTGRLDDWAQILGGDGFYVAVDPTNPDVVYAESQFGQLSRSTDGGRMFAPAMNGIGFNEKTNWSAPLVIDPHNPRVLYYGTYRLYRSTDRAGTWRPVSDNLARQSPAFPRVGTITTIAVAPSDSNVVYAGTDDGYVWVTSDYGASWRNVSAGLPFRWVTRLAVDPRDAATAYVTFSGLKWRDPQPHVFRTTDQGQTWHDVSSNLPDAPVNAFVLDPARPEVLYLGSDVGAFVSLDAGETWEPLGDGLPAVSIYDLKIHPTARYLVAGTHGRSMYRLDLPAITARDPSTPAPPAGARLEPGFPNPFASSVDLRFHLDAPGRVRLEVYDLLGRRLRTLVDAPAAAGPHTARWDGTDAAGRFVPAGTYVARLTSGDDGAARHSVLLTRVP